MNKEPLALYLFRFVMGAALLFFIGMLYWSSQLIEQDLKSLHVELDKVRTDLTKVINERPITLEENGTVVPPKQKERPQINPNLPNLLKEDPFYQVTLPKLLGPGFKPLGTFHDDAISRPSNIHVFSEWAQVSDWRGLCMISVSRQQFGKFDTMSPFAAIKMEERKIPGTEESEYWIHLRDDLYWQPLKRSFFPDNIQLAPHFLKKHQITAHDFKFYIDAIMNPYNQLRGALALRTYFQDLKEFRVIDDLTFAVRWKTQLVKQDDGKMVPKIKYEAKSWTGGLQPLASFVYQYYSDGKKIIEDDSNPDTYRTSSVWGQSLTDHWAKNIITSCGPWVFDGMTDAQISFRRNNEFFMPLAALGERNEIRFKESPEGAWQDFKTNQIDTYNLQFDQVMEWQNFLKSTAYAKQAENGERAKRLDYIARRFSYVGWNQAKPYFKSKKVRQALTMAIDRQRIIQQNLNGYGLEIAGTFLPTILSETDPSIKPWPYDPLKAKRYLEEEGWYDRSGTGIIEKEIDGKLVPFRFYLTYYVKNPLTKSLCEYISTALREIGIECNLNGVDVADLSAKLDDKSFDALVLAWVFGTPPDNPRQIWHSSGAKERGSSNSIGFANAEADAIIEKLEYEYNPDKRRDLYYKFDAIIHEEQPYTFLFTPKLLLVYREYVQNVFIPADRQDLVPGADVPEPDSSIFWLRGAPKW